jgi:phospholipase D1/2
VRSIECFLFNLQINFLEASNLSFVADLGYKGKEGTVLKKAGSSLPGQTGCNCCGLLQQGICSR